MGEAGHTLSGMSFVRDAPRALWAVRIGQLTGTTGEHWPDLVDAPHWPLLIDTGSWGMWGVDLGANVEHADGRLYFFFGDTAEKPFVPRNADLVAWAEDVVRHGGHQRLGWTFHLPSREAQQATEATDRETGVFPPTATACFSTATRARTPAPVLGAAESVCVRCLARTGTSIPSERPNRSA